MRRFRIHGWIELEATDEEMAKLCASVAFSRFKNDPDVLAYGISGRPTDLQLFRKNPLGRK